MGQFSYRIPIPLISDIKKTDLIFGVLKYLFVNIWNIARNRPNKCPRKIFNAFTEKDIL